MKLGLTFLFSLLSSFSFSQTDTVLLLGVNGKIVENKDKALRYQDFQKLDENNYKIYFYSKRDNDWDETGQMHITKIDDNKFKLNSTEKDEEDVVRVIKDTNEYFLVIDYYPDNTTYQVGYSTLPFPLCKTSTWVTYHKNGVKRSQEFYSNNRLIRNLRWDEQGNEDISNVFLDADIMPKYKNGDHNKFRSEILKRMRYPIYAAENNIQGRVIMEFIVMEDGYIDGIRVAEGVHPSLDQASYKLIENMPQKWTPGYTDGKPVRVLYRFPLTYKIH